MKVSESYYNNPYDSYSVSQAAETSATKVAEAPAESTTIPSAVYEQSSQSATQAPASATYTLNKMSAEDRASFVQALKDKQAQMEQSFINIVRKSLERQVKNYSFAMDDDSMWKFLASGQYTVDAATKAQAQKDISEDGYWGVNQTAQRLFDFASALAGDDVDKMKQMQSAMEKGFKQATGSWGKDLPGICGDTLKKANEMFEDYYKSKE